MFHIENDGPLVVKSNFWDDPMAQSGYFFMSWNAGAGRLLVPDSQLDMLPDMQSAEEVIVSVGPWPRAGFDTATELLFEDHSDEPLVLHIGPQQTDRVLPESDSGTPFPVTVWGRNGLLHSMPARYRRVSKIPCMRPWGPLH